MNTENLPSQATMAWKIIGLASAAEQPKLYWEWGRKVIAAQDSDELTVKEAAELLIPTDDSELSKLGAVADVLIVLDTADAILEGDAYISAPDNEARDWADIVERVKRHAAK
jgi:hypothetical protein